MSNTYRRIWEQVFRGQTYCGNLQVRTRQGGPRELEVIIAAARDTKGHIASLVCSGRDASRTRETETRISQARRMDAIGTLAGGVAHDFNNMLMVISAYAELGLDSLPKEHALWRHLQEILSASRRASELTRQLLAFGRKQVQQLQLLNLNSVVEEACGMLPCVIGEDVDLQLELGRNLGQVMVDSGQISQVLLNLAINARDAMPHAGKLTIATRFSDGRRDGVGEGPEGRAGGYILLTISDTGLGIAEADLPRIFEPFYTTKPEGAGTGLGLAMVYGIIRQSNGLSRCRARRESAAFSRFICRSPRHPCASLPSLPPRKRRCTAVQKPCWWSKTRMRCGNLRSNSFPASAIPSWQPRTARRPWIG